MVAAISLPENLDLKAAAPLKAAFLERRGAEILIEADQVRRLGGLCLQVLLAARKTWAADGLNLRLGFVSEALAEQWAAFGAPDFNAEGALA